MPHAGHSNESQTNAPADGESHAAQTEPARTEPARTETAQTWAALLAHWTSVAQSAVAIPPGETGDRWRASVAPAIGLQALGCALDDLDSLAPGEDRAVAQDLAEVQIRAHAAELAAAWATEAMPEGLLEILTEARAALESSREVGLVWHLDAEALAAEGEDRAVFPHPGELAALLASSGFEGDLLWPSPGVPVFGGSPVAFLRSPGGAVPPEPVAAAVHETLALTCGPALAGPERGPGLQVYRQFDFAAGRAVRDVVTPFMGEPQAGQPLLVHALLEGQPSPVSLPPRPSAEMAPLEVVDLTEDGDPAEIPPA